MVQKTSTSKSRSKSAKTSTGKRVTRSSGKSKTTTASSLEKNLKTLTSTKQPKKTGKTSGTKAKAKAKTLTTTRSTTRTSKKDRGVKHTRCKDTELFPVSCMPWRLEPRTKKFNLSWFMCFDHAVDQIERSNLKPRDYKLMCHTSVPISDPLTGGVRTQRYVRGS